MAVLIDFEVPDATTEQMYALEELTRARGEEAGAPPYPGCVFIAVSPQGSGFRFVSAWRTEAAYRHVLETMLRPDLGAVGATVGEATVSEIIAMAIPGART